MSRLPAIDPNTRTLILTGYPNVGKSSFMNKVTRANVDVQPYAFTTKSLFVGHMDYKYLQWQARGVACHASAALAFICGGDCVGIYLRWRLWWAFVALRVLSGV